LNLIYWLFTLTYLWQFSGIKTTSQCIYSSTASKAYRSH